MNAQRPAADRLAHIAIIGAGVSGRSFSRHLLRHGLRVTLEDVLPSNLRSVTSELEQQTPYPGTGALTLVSTVEDAVRSADLAIDFVPDELESKLEILSMIDRMAPPRTVLLTPTDTLSITDLASCTYRAERCLALSGLSRLRPFEPLPPGDLRLLHPHAVDLLVLARVQDLLRSIALPFLTAPDPHPSGLSAR